MAARRTVCAQIPKSNKRSKKPSAIKREEESYREGETAHFTLKYNGSATPDLARGILRALEDDFRDLESQLDYTPPESDRRDPLYRPGLCRYHPRARLGGRAERRAAAHSRAGPEQRDAGTCARAEARTHAQLRGTEIARPRADLAAGRRRAVDGRAPQQLRQPGRWSKPPSKARYRLSERWKARGWAFPEIRRRLRTRGRLRWSSRSSTRAA